MYETAYQRSATWNPKISNEKISGLMSGKGIILESKTLFFEMIKTRSTHNARVSLQSLSSGLTATIQQPLRFKDNTYDASFG